MILEGGPGGLFHRRHQQLEKTIGSSFLLISCGLIIFGRQSVIWVILMANLSINSTQLDAIAHLSWERSTIDIPLCGPLLRTLQYTLYCIFARKDVKDKDFSLCVVDTTDIFTLSKLNNQTCSFPCANRNGWKTWILTLPLFLLLNVGRNDLMAGLLPCLCTLLPAKYKYIYHSVPAIGM